MARGRGSLRVFDRQPSGRWVAPSRNCPACGRSHQRIPESCQRLIDGRYAVSHSDRHRAPAPVAPLIRIRAGMDAGPVTPQDARTNRGCP